MTSTVNVRLIAMANYLKDPVTITMALKTHANCMIACKTESNESNKRKARKQAINEAINQVGACTLRKLAIKTTRKSTQIATMLTIKEA